MRGQLSWQILGPVCRMTAVMLCGDTRPAHASLFVRVEGDVAISDGGWSFGVSWVDYDGDSYPDLYVNNNDFGSVGELNCLYHNNGDGSYSRVDDGVISAEGGSVASTWADFDNDGDNDVYVSCFGQLNYFYLNNGDGVFTKMVSGPLGIPEEGTMEADWIDYTSDGRLDLFVVNHRPPSGPLSSQYALYLNDGGFLVLQSNSAIGLIEDEGNGIAWGDYDNCPFQGDFDDDGFLTSLDLAAEIDILAGSSDTQDFHCPTTRADLDCDSFATALHLAVRVDHRCAGGDAPRDPCLPKMLDVPLGASVVIGGVIETGESRIAP